eukprot:6941893-Prorocentrum_lima.AAC.1
MRRGCPLVEATFTPNTLEVPGGTRVQWLHTTFAAALSALRCGLVVAHEDAGAGGVAVYSHPSLLAVLEKDVSALLVAPTAVESRGLRDWLNAECCLQVR